MYVGVYVYACWQLAALCAYMCMYYYIITCTVYINMYFYEFMYCI